MKNRRLLSALPIEPVTRSEAVKFLKKLQEFRARDGKPIDEAGIREFLDKMSVASRQAIARRILMDILKSPTNDFIAGARDELAHEAPSYMKPLADLLKA